MMRSAKASMSPGTVFRAASISRASRSMTLRSWPMTLTPTGVRMPVASMSMRALIGMVQAFETPGNCRARSISWTSRSRVMPGRHALSGFRLMTVSNISVGAGSVAVAARPALPNTDCTSGNVLMILFCVCSSSADLVIESPGKVVGMYMSVPSLRFGMNSVPSLVAGQTLAARTTRASRTVSVLARSTPRMTGR